MLFHLCWCVVCYRACLRARMWTRTYIASVLGQNTNAAGSLHTHEYFVTAEVLLVLVSVIAGV